MSRCTTAFCVLMIACLASRAAPLSAQQKETFDTSYISAHSYFSIVVRPARLLKYVEKAKADRFASQGAEEDGVDLRLMDEAIIDFGTDDVKPSTKLIKRDNNIAVIGRFHGVLNREAMLNEFSGSKEAVERDGKIFYLATSKNRSGLFFPDKNSFVFARNDRLQKLMSQPHSTNTMVRRLREAGRDYDLLMIADVNSAREIAPDFMRMALFLGIGDFKPQEYIKKISSAKLRAKLSEDVPIAITIATTDEESAAEIQALCKSLLLKGKGIWATESRKFLLDADRVTETGKIVVGVVDQLLAGTKIEAKGNEVAVRIEKKGGFAELAEFSLGMFGGRGGPVPVPGPPKDPKVPPIPDGPKR